MVHIKFLIAVTLGTSGEKSRGLGGHIGRLRIPGQVPFSKTSDQ